MRKVLLHYHLFKNAGSSIDEILSESFGDKWMAFDRDVASAKIMPSEISAAIDQFQSLRAVSSHQAMPPLPQGEFEVFPVVFLRHPIDRARSAYLFEWKKQLGLSVPKGSFADYVREKLAPGNQGPIANFQVYQLSNAAVNGARPIHSSEPTENLFRAKQLLKELPYFGLVERFHESLERMHFYLKYHFPELRLVNRQLNATQDRGKSLEDKLLSIRKELGDALFGELSERNRLDLELYKFATVQFDSVIPRES